MNPETTKWQLRFRPFPEGFAVFLTFVFAGLAVVVYGLSVQGGGWPAAIAGWLLIAGACALIWWPVLREWQGKDSLG